MKLNITLIASILAVILAIYFLRSWNPRESFNIIGYTMTGEPKPQQTPTYSKPSVVIPDAIDLSLRNKLVHQTEMSCMEQISNHRQPDEYATMDNGTAKPFEMSSEFFHSCDPSKVIPRQHDFTMPADKTPNKLRVGAFSYDG